MPEAFGREVKEEIGIDVNYDEAELLDIIVWKMDKEKNGKLIKDRAFANVYILCINEDNYNFVFNDDEVNGVVKVKANDTLELFHNNVSEIIGEVVTANNKERKTITKDDFLLMKGEDLISKYGNILEAIKRK